MRCRPPTIAWSCADAGRNRTSSRRRRRSLSQREVSSKAPGP
jgi:hypothetical protein